MIKIIIVEKNGVIGWNAKQDFYPLDEIYMFNPDTRRIENGIVKKKDDE